MLTYVVQTICCAVMNVCVGSGSSWALGDHTHVLRMPWANSLIEDGREQLRGTCATGRPLKRGINVLVGHVGKLARPDADTRPVPM